MLSRRRSFLRVGAAVAVAASLSTAAGGCMPSEEVHAAGHAVFASLRAGDVDGAYAQLSRQRRAATTREQFAALVDHPALLGNRDTTLERLIDYHPGYCVMGSLHTDGGDWAVQLFAIAEGEAWRVHSLAIQPPASIRLGVLLPECGLSAGTLRGYRGPPIERTTVPTRN